MRQIETAIGIGLRLRKMSAMDGWILASGSMNASFCACRYTINLSISLSATLSLVSSMQLLLCLPAHLSILIHEFKIRLTSLPNSRNRQTMDLMWQIIIFSVSRNWVQEWTFDLMTVRSTWNLARSFKREAFYLLAKVNLLECEPITNKKWSIES